MYVAPEIKLVERFKVEPSHKGLLLVMTGADGGIFIITSVVDVWEAQLLTVIIRLYTPAFNEVVLLITGLCRLEVNPFGPVQLYVAPRIYSAMRFKVEPSQRGPLFEIVAADGIGLTTTSIVDKPEAQLFTVVIRL